MKPMNLDQVVRNIDRRLERVEQILPTLPTRDEMHTALDAAIRGAVAPLATREELDRKVAVLATREDLERKVAPLATREELDRKVAPLATKVELAALGERLDARITEEADRSRTYTKIHYEDLKDDIRLLADGVVKVQTTLDQMVRPKLEDHERRITALEDERSRSRGGPQG